MLWPSLLGYGFEYILLDLGTCSRKKDEQRIMVAIKILKPDTSEKNKQNFFGEASIMGQFNHPNVIFLYEKKQTNRTSYLTSNSASILPSLC